MIIVYSIIFVSFSSISILLSSGCSSKPKRSRASNLSTRTAIPGTTDSASSEKEAPASNRSSGKEKQKKKSNINLAANYSMRTAVPGAVTDSLESKKSETKLVEKNASGTELDKKTSEQKVASVKQEILPMLPMRVAEERPIPEALPPPPPPPPPPPVVVFPIQQSPVQASPVEKKASLLLKMVEPEKKKSKMENLNVMVVKKEEKMEEKKKIEPIQQQVEPKKIEPEKKKIEPVPPIELKKVEPEKKKIEPIDQKKIELEKKKIEPVQPVDQKKIEPEKKEDVLASTPEEENKKPHVSVDSLEISFTAGASNQSKLTIKNIHDKKVMFKIKLSDNVTFLVNPVYGSLEPGKTINVAVTHKKSAPLLAKLVIVNSVMNVEEKDIAAAFKSLAKPTGGPMNVKLVAK